MGNSAAILMQPESVARHTWLGRQMMGRLDLQSKEQLSERACIAQDLQDTVLEGLASLSTRLHGLHRREGIRGFRPSNVSSQGLERALLRSYEKLTVRQEPCRAGFRLIVLGAPRPLHLATRNEVYQISREALINAVSHSRASKIEIELEYTVSSLRVLIRDNGCGIDPEVFLSGRLGHHGLSGMRECAQRIEAKFRVLSRAGAGTEVELYMPGHIAFGSRPVDRSAGWLGRLSRWETRKENSQREIGLGR